MKKRKKKIDPLVRTLERECEKHLRHMSVLHDRCCSVTQENQRLRQVIRMLLHARNNSLVRVTWKKVRRK